MPGESAQVLARKPRALEATPGSPNGFPRLCIPWKAGSERTLRSPNHSTEVAQTQLAGVTPRIVSRRGRDAESSVRPRNRADTRARRSLSHLGSDSSFLDVPSRRLRPTSGYLTLISETCSYFSGVLLRNCKQQPREPLDVPQLLDQEAMSSGSQRSRHLGQDVPPVALAPHAGPGGGAGAPSPLLSPPLLGTRNRHLPRHQMRMPVFHTRPQPPHLEGPASRMTLTLSPPALRGGLLAQRPLLASSSCPGLTHPRGPSHVPALHAPRAPLRLLLAPSLGPHSAGPPRCPSGICPSLPPMTAHQTPVRAAPGSHPTSHTCS